MYMHTQYVKIVNNMEAATSKMVSITHPKMLTSYSAPKQSHC